MTSSMPPIARKKPVLNKYTPNTYRVISMGAETIPSEPRRQVEFKAAFDFNVIGQPESTHPSKEYRHNRPHPCNIGFLRQDVNLMLEPLCDVHNTSTKMEQHLWWPSRTSDEPLKTPPYAVDSISRNDYQWRGTEVKGNTRHSSNPHKEPVDGIVPVHHFKQPNGKQRFWKENISYEHKYDCRLDPSYPIRSKRHGSFVWDEFPPSEVAKMLHYFGYNANKEVQTDIENSKQKNASNGAVNGTKEDSSSLLHNRSENQNNENQKNNENNKNENNNEASSSSTQVQLNTQYIDDNLPPVCN